jgi:hypothetical protein
LRAITPGRQPGRADLGLDACKDRYRTARELRGILLVESKLQLRSDRRISGFHQECVFWKSLLSIQKPISTVLAVVEMGMSVPVNLRALVRTRSDLLDAGLLQFWGNPTFFDFYLLILFPNHRSLLQGNKPSVD